MTRERKSRQKDTVVRTEDEDTYTKIWRDAQFARSDAVTWIRSSWMDSTLSGTTTFSFMPETTSTRVIRDADDHTFERFFPLTGGTRDPQTTLFDIALRGFETLENRLVKCEADSETVQNLGMRVKKLEERLERIEYNTGPQHEVVVVEEIGRDEARGRILEYIETHDGADTEDLMKNLKIDLALLVEILDELKKEGKIESIDGSS